MSESFEQVPGQEQVRHACRITPHPSVKGAVQVFVEGLQFPVTNIFDAQVNLLERGLIAEDPRMQMCIRDSCSRARGEDLAQGIILDATQFQTAQG